METTYKRAFEFENAARIFLDTNKDETKFSEAINDVLEQLEPARGKFNKYSGRIRRNRASVDKQMNILREENGNYKYTAENEEKVQDEIDDLLDQEGAVEFDSVITEEPKGLAREFKKFFKGFVIE